jgi:hypothetical protein
MLCWQFTPGLVEVFVTVVCLVQVALLIISLLIVVWILAKKKKGIRKSSWLQLFRAKNQLDRCKTHPTEIEDYYNITKVPETKTAQARLWPVPSLKPACVLDRCKTRSTEIEHYARHIQQK